MTPQIQNWMQSIRERFPFKPGNVLEVGSYDVNGGVKQFFSDAMMYLGIDQMEGPGVDRVMSSWDLLDHFGANSFDTIICCEMLEHDPGFIHTLHNIREMTRPKGHLIITVPTFGFPLHRYPKDYWRFGEDALRELFFLGFEILELTHLDDPTVPNGSLVCIGRKPSNQE